MIAIKFEELEQEKEIFYEELNQSYLDAINDKNSRKLLDSIMDIPKSILEISTETNIPLRTAYRKIQALCDSKLVKVSGNLSKGGRKFFLYKSKIRSVVIKYEKNHFTAKIIKN